MPEDARPATVEVPQRLFVRAARIVAEAGYGMPAHLRWRLGVGDEMAAQLMLALEAAGVVGSPYGSGGQARALVRLDDLSALFVRLGIVTDALPPDARPH